VGERARAVEDMVLDRALWRGRRVLVTGHTGFKGAWLCLWLQRLGAEVSGYALAPETPSLFESAQVTRGMQSIQGDVRDADALRAAFARIRPEIVVHMAAQSLVRESYSDPVGTYATNVMGTAHALEAARAAGSVRAFVNVTSDKCYENRESSRAYSEGDPMGGHDPYSSSKGCAELVTAAYRRSFLSGAGAAMALASARAGNVIGGGDWAPDRLVPDFFRAVSAGKPLVVRNPDAVRPWQFVLEPLYGYLLLAQALWHRPAEFAEAWNFGPDAQSEQPVRRVVQRLVELWGGGAAWETGAGAHLHEAQMLKLDCAKANVRLGWRPRMGLDAALERIVEWTRAWFAREDLRRVTQGQLESYEASLGERQPA
jgi:CDP-glucose 4,6-dehydratase